MLAAWNSVMAGLPVLVTQLIRGLSVIRPRRETNVDLPQSLPELDSDVVLDLRQAALRDGDRVVVARCRELEHILDPVVAIQEVAAVIAAAAQQRRSNRGTQRSMREEPRYSYLICHIGLPLWPFPRTTTTWSPRPSGYSPRRTHY
jgi:hypothetical protein